MSAADFPGHDLHNNPPPFPPDKPEGERTRMLFRDPVGQTPGWRKKGLVAINRSAALAAV